VDGLPGSEAGRGKSAAQTALEPDARRTSNATDDRTGRSDFPRLAPLSRYRMNRFDTISGRHFLAI
jgi:hypothetical protein